MTDEEILYTTGKYRLNWIDYNLRKSVIKRYEIDPQNPRPGIIRFMQGTTAPIMPDSQEVIHRENWNLNSLVGETEGQLLHQDYYKLNKYILSHHKRQHDTLTIFQCSSKKPYSENRILKHKYFIPYKDYTDFACISNPGIIPIEYSGFYPYRYDEWNIYAEDRLPLQLEIPLKYRIVNMWRFLNYVREMGYKNVICVISNKKKQWIFEEMLKLNLCDCNKWLHLITDDHFRSQLSQQPEYSNLKNFGIFFSRIPNLLFTKEKYEEVLNKCVTSCNPPISSILFKASPGEIYKLYSHPQEEDSLLYKKQYFTCLDKLMTKKIHGTDIDGEYWKLYNTLTDDRDSVQLDNSFIFIRDKFKDNVTEIRKEAYKIGLVKEDGEFQMKKSIFNCVSKEKQ